MIFVFHEYVDFLIATGRRNNLALSYIKQVEDFRLMKDFNQTKPYCDYVSKMPVFEYLIPAGDRFNRSWELFLQLALAGISSRVKVVSEKSSNLPRVNITVNGKVDGEPKTITRFVDELALAQVYRMIDIYLDELFSQELQRLTDPVKGMFIDEEREICLKRAKNIEIN